MTAPRRDYRALRLLVGFLDDRVEVEGFTGFESQRDRDFGTDRYRVDAVQHQLETHRFHDQTAIGSHHESFSRQHDCILGAEEVDVVCIGA